jgi:hypothetical protein
LPKVLARGVDVSGSFFLATRDGRAAQLFYGGKEGATERVSALLAQYLSQQGSERSDVAPQRRFLPITSAGFEFREPVGPADRRPQRGHT